jgi:polar amino acid transport system substrate-binding protein
MKKYGFVPVWPCLIGPCLVLLLASPLSQATETLKVITIDAPPWVSRSNETGELSGAFIDVIEELTSRTEYSFDITLSPFARVARELQGGTQDCTILVPLPSNYVDRGELVLQQPLGAIAHKSIVLASYEDLYNQRISILRGVSVNSRFGSDEALDKIFDKDYSSGLRKLSRKRVDIVVGAISTLQYIARIEGIEDSLGEPLVLAKIPLLFQCSKKSTHLDAMAPISSAIKLMHADGTIDVIKQRHGF